MNILRIGRAARRFLRPLTRVEIKRKSLRVESLERRELLAIDSFHNASLPTDVNGDGRTNELDVQIILNDLETRGARHLAAAAKMVVSAGLPTGDEPNYLDVNNDGSVSQIDALNVVNALEETTALAKVELEITDLNGNLITKVQPGQEFQLRVYVDDVRPGAEDLGVYSAYFDLLYDAAGAEVSGAIQFTDDFTFSRQGDTGTDGLISGAGAGSSAVTPTGTPRRLLMTVPMTAETVGTVNFTSQFTANTLLDFGLFDLDTALTETEIDFGTATLEVAFPQASISDATVVEGDNGEVDLVFTVTLSEEGIQTAAIGWETDDLTGVADAATAGTDYTFQQGALVFAPGETQKTITIKVNGDQLSELDERFLVRLLTPAANVTIDDGEAIGTITDDDDAPVASIESPDPITEGDSGTKQLSFTVKLSEASGQEVIVNFETVAGTAIAGDDFVAQTGSVTFAPGETEKTIVILVVGDEVAEDAEQTFLVRLTGASAATVSAEDDEATGTILDDDNLPVISIDSPTITEGAAGGTKQLTFTISLSAASTDTVTVTYQTQNGTATVGQDYTGIGPLQVTFQPGETSKTITVDILGDNAFGLDENFTVQLSSPTNATIAAGAAGIGTGTITNDDAAPTVSVATPDPFTEPNAPTNLGFLVTLTGDIETPVEVTFATTPGTATAGADYTANSGTLTFLPGEPNTQTINISILPDQLDEADETFDVTIDSEVATLGTATATGTIEDDDDAAPEVSIVQTAQTTEGDAGTKTLAFTVSLSAASGKTITIDYATFAGTAADDSDYDAQSGTLTFAPGETQKTIQIVINGDEAIEQNENFEVRLNAQSATNASVGNATAVATIQNDDLPEISVGNAQITEGDAGTKQLTFTITLSQASPFDVTLNFATADGTATAGQDYVAQNGSITFEAGETEKTVTIVINGDTVDENDETFALNLTDVTGATPTSTSATGTIQDDDVDPIVSIDSVSVEEGDDGTKTLVFTVTLAEAPTKTVTVNYATSDDTATFTGGNPDYVAKTGTLTFQPGGPLTQTIEIVINGDTIDEANETFKVTLSNLTNAKPGTVVGTGTITDDDTSPTATISVDKTTVAESGDAAARLITYTVTLSEAPTNPVTINIGTSGTAGAPGDYAAPPASITFNPGDPLTKTFTVQVNDDVLDENDETLIVTLTGGTNVVIGATSSATVTIQDNDTNPIVSIEDAFISEGDNGEKFLTFRVFLSSAALTTSTVSYATSIGDGNTATSNVDFEQTSGTVTFEAGETEKFVTVKIFGDTIDENNETFTVTLSNLSNLRSGDLTATGTIQDDDTNPTVSVSDATIVEGDDGTKQLVFTVTLSGPAKNAVGVTVTTSNGTATAGQDYEALTHVLNFAVGETSKTFSVTILGDDLDEANETFTVTLGSLINVSAGDVTGIGTIEDDDDPPTITLDAIVEGIEGDANGNKTAEFIIRLSAASGRAVTGTFSTQAMNALADSDFIAVNQQFTIQPGQTEIRIPVTIVGDNIPELDEAFSVRLTNLANATAGAKTQLEFVIKDNDPRRSISGYTYNDLDGDGRREAGEAGLAGVTIELRQLSNQGQVIGVRTTTTDANGRYQFDDVIGGFYTIAQIQPSGYTDGQVTYGTGGQNFVAEPNEITVGVSDGSLTDYNFGEQVAQPTPTPGSISISKKNLFGSSRRT